MLGMALVYEHGNKDVPRDYEAAAYWYRRVCEGTSSVEALLGLARIHYFGLGVPRDFSKAFYYYSRLDGNAIALFRLGKLYDLGQGLPADPTKALSYYTRSAQGGNLAARRRLGITLIRQGKYLAGLYHAWFALATRAVLKTFRPNSKRLRNS